jgi:hypothetical protein
LTPSNCPSCRIYQQIIEGELCPMPVEGRVLHPCSTCDRFSLFSVEGFYGFAGWQSTQD